MKIGMIGSTSYKHKMLKMKTLLEEAGDTVMIPAFDDRKDLDAYGVCMSNMEMIKDADEIYLFWDQRSMGTVFDFGICFALQKKVRIIYMEPKTFKSVMEEYEKQIFEEE